MTAPGPAGTGGPVALVEELRRRFLAGDPDGAFALYHPDITIEQPASLPHGGRHRGRSGVEAMALTFAARWDRTIGEPELSEWGDSVVQVTSQTWTSKATGRAATVDVVELITLRDGVVEAIRVFPQDTHLLLATLDGAEG